MKNGGRNSGRRDRQFLATAENCSRHHLIATRDTTLNGSLTRMQAPERDVSSMVAGARCGTPPSSSHEISAKARTTVLGSMLRTSMPSVSPRWKQSVVNSGGAGSLP
jgi:hypothetical protein